MFCKLLWFTFLYNFFLLFNITNFFDIIISSISLYMNYIAILGYHFNIEYFLYFSHKMLSILTPVGVFLFNEVNSLLFVSSVLILIICSRFYYKICLFDIYSRKLNIPDIGFNSYNFILLLLLFYCFYNIHGLIYLPQ